MQKTWPKEKKKVKSPCWGRWSILRRVIFFSMRTWWMNSLHPSSIISQNMPLAISHSAYIHQTYLIFLLDHLSRLNIPLRFSISYQEQIMHLARRYNAHHTTPRFKSSVWYIFKISDLIELHMQRMQAAVQQPWRRLPFLNPIVRFPERSGSCGAVDVVVSVFFDKHPWVSL